MSSPFRSHRTCSKAGGHGLEGPVTIYFWATQNPDEIMAFVFPLASLSYTEIASGRQSGCLSRSATAFIPFTARTREGPGRELLSCVMFFQRVLIFSSEPFGFIQWSGESIRSVTGELFKPYYSHTVLSSSPSSWSSHKVCAFPIAQPTLDCDCDQTRAINLSNKRLKVP